MADRSNVFVISIVALVAVVGLVTLFLQGGQSQSSLVGQSQDITGQAYQLPQKYLPKPDRPIPDRKDCDCTTEIVITNPSDGSVCKELEVFRNDAGDLYDVSGPRPVRVHYREARDAYTYPIAVGDIILLANHAGRRSMLQYMGHSGDAHIEELDFVDPCTGKRVVKGEITKGRFTINTLIVRGRTHRVNGDATTGNINIDLNADGAVNGWTMPGI